MADPKPADALLRVPLNLGTLVTIVTLGVAIAGFAWTSAVRLTQIEARLETQASRLDQAVATGREQREAIARASAERHQQQQAEIDRMRLDQAATTAFIAETRAKLDALGASIARIESWLRPADAPRR
jgi:septal ring factor EnvC (AmiA/AmiB activator)